MQCPLHLLMLRFLPRKDTHSSRAVHQLQTHSRCITIAEVDIEMPDQAPALVHLSHKVEKLSRIIDSSA